MVKFARLAVAVAAAGSLAVLGSGAAAQAAAGPPEYNNIGEAGYSTQPVNSSWHFRYVKATFTVTPAMKTLNVATGSQLGGTGVQLCDPTGVVHEAAQSGLVWNSGTQKFEGAYDFGTLTATAPSTDACTSGGVISPAPPLYTGTLGTISVGDSITTSIFYNNKLGVLVFAFTDNTTAQFDSEVVPAGVQRFFEAGAGIQDVESSLLSAPAVNDVVDFTGVALTGYQHLGSNVTRGTFTSGPWQTTEGSSDPSGDGSTPLLASPNNSLSGGGRAFSVFIGSPVG